MCMHEEWWSKWRTPQQMNTLANPDPRRNLGTHLTPTLALCFSLQILSLYRIELAGPYLERLRAILASNQVSGFGQLSDPA